MGLPLVNITFIEKAVSAVTRSSRGIVALILKDDTKAAGETIYGGIDEVTEADFTPTNYDYISKTFLGTPTKVIVERIATTTTDYSGVLAILKNKKFNYLAIPDIATGDVATIATFIKTQYHSNNKTFKAVLPHSVSDDECIINYTTEGNKVGTTTYTAAQYCCRLAGIFAGLGFDRSSTYYVLSELDSITESITPDTDIDNGQLILINDGDNIKIGRGVNSLTTTTTTKGSDYKKIRIIEELNLVLDDVRDTWNNSYAGKCVGDYDNKILFIVAISAYFATLEKENILDPSASNLVEIDTAAVITYLKGLNIDTSALSVQQIKEYNTDSKVFITANTKFLDAMEDLNFSINM